MKDTTRFTYGRTSVFNINYHIIWGTKYRNKVLQGEVETTFKRILSEIADKYNFTISHIEIGKSDHVHLLVSAPPKISVTKLLQYLKGETARRLFLECDELKQSYWKQVNRHLWSSSYFVETIGTTNQAAIAKYIDDQKQKEVDIHGSKGD